MGSSKAPPSVPDLESLLELQTDVNRYDLETSFGSNTWEKGPDGRWTNTRVGSEGIENLLGGLIDSANSDPNYYEPSAGVMETRDTLGGRFAERYGATVAQPSPDPSPSPQEPVEDPVQEPQDPIPPVAGNNPPADPPGGDPGGNNPPAGTQPIYDDPYEPNDPVPPVIVQSNGGTASNGGTVGKGGGAYQADVMPMTEEQQRAVREQMARMLQGGGNV